MVCCHFLQQYPNLFEVTLTGQYNRKNKPMFTFKVQASHVQLLEAAAAAAGQVGGGSGTGGVAPGFGGGASSGASSSAPAVGGTAPTTPALKRPRPPPGLGPPASASTAQAHKAWGKVQVQRPSGLWEELPPAPQRPPPGAPQPAAPQGLAVQQAAPAPAGGGTAPAQAAPAPAVGGAAPVFVPSDIPAVGARRLGGAAPVFVPSGIPVGPASSWSIKDMVTYLDAIALGHLNPIIRENGLDGVFFLHCTGGLASHWHWTGAVEENQDVYATVTSRPLAAMPGQPRSAATSNIKIAAVSQSGRTVATIHTHNR